MPLLVFISYLVRDMLSLLYCEKKRHTSCFFRILDESSSAWILRISHQKVQS